jgi:hypothetical protein
MKGHDYLMFYACLEVEVKVASALCLDSVYNKAFKLVLRDRVQEKAE